MSPDVQTLATNIGKRGWVNLGDIRIRITIRDVGYAYGHVRYFIEPIAGSGSGWVDAKKVVIDVQNGEQ